MSLLISDRLYKLLFQWSLQILQLQIRGTVAAAYVRASPTIHVNSLAKLQIFFMDLPHP